jgi:hypothetical protein
MRRSDPFYWLQVLFGGVLSVCFALPLSWALTKAGMPVPAVFTAVLGVGMIIGSLVGKGVI